MVITRKSPLTGVVHTMDLPITQAQIDMYNSGEGYIQTIFSNLTKDQCEFIHTGYTKEDWDAMFPPEDDEEDYPSEEDLMPDLGSK